MDELITEEKKWVLTPEALEKLLLRLDADRERAGHEYEHIRRSLILFFRSNGCDTPEEATDETIDRVAKKISEGTVIYTPEPSFFFRGVAKNVLHEYLRRPEADSVPPTGNPEQLAKLECMEKCLAELPAQTQRMLVEYSQGDYYARMKNSRLMAARMGVSLNTLRIRVCRTRERLAKCVSQCLKRRNEKEW